MRVRGSRHPSSATPPIGVSVLGAWLFVRVVEEEEEEVVVVVVVVVVEEEEVEEGFSL